ncbi:helix-turn-helix domain-containing protein [Streptomyces sp. NPDC005803]|uniref:helix-turn-helix domain-containing protein n=1 Tax=Streptomyces sp. NPDC005803 TaxID=3154297 RepID=UPI003401DD6E
MRVCAQVVLHAARGRSTARIARETGLHLDTVRTWRGRFAERGLAGLSDRKRSGRPPSFTALQVISADEKTSIQARCHRPWHPGRPGPCASTTSTSAAAPWPTWRPTTSTAPSYSAAASQAPASCRS